MEEVKVTDLREDVEGLDNLIAKFKEFEEKKKKLDEESELVCAFADEHNDFLCSLSKESASKLISLIAIKASENPIETTLILMTTAYLSIKTLNECSIVADIGDDTDRG